MSQSLVRVVLHITFSTKYRTPWLKDPNIRDELYRYVATVLKGLDCPAIEINGVEDHLHVLCNLARNYAVKTLLGKVKAETSKWIKTKGVPYREFYWQAGYGAYSVGESRVGDVRRYIQRQEEHHHRMTFQEEFRALCKKHGISVDERYAWD
jgi:putative transposase